MSIGILLVIDFLFLIVFLHSIGKLTAFISFIVGIIFIPWHIYNAITIAYYALAGGFWFGVRRFADKRIKSLLGGLTKKIDPKDLKQFTATEEKKK